jgi:8-hydroxy-5-deazaflavin:NADPH oxidoreductase
MSYAIIGFGKIGQAIAKAFARKGIEVSVATTRDPESFTAVFQGRREGLHWWKTG